MAALSSVASDADDDADVCTFSSPSNMPRPMMQMANACGPLLDRDRQRQHQRQHNEDEPERARTIDARLQKAGRGAA